jgi:RNA polymerase sigma-54 factor
MGHSPCNGTAQIALHMSSARLVLAPQAQQTQTASLRLQHAVRLLQMSSQDFLQSVNNTIQSNPFLEGNEEEEPVLPAPLQALVADEPVAAMPEPEAGDNPAPDSGAEARDDADGDDSPSDVAPADDWGTPGSADGGGVSALDLTPAAISLSGHLHAQLNLLHLEPRDMALAKAVVELLDDDGYLRCDPGEALADWAEAAALQPTGDDLNLAVRRVQSLDPPGVGARSVQECLLLQLDLVADGVQRALIREILLKHLQRLAGNDLAAIARAVQAPLADVQAACTRIRHFDPRPGWRYGGTMTRYITPDVIVQRHKGQWRAMLNPAVVPRVSLNRQVVDLFQSSRKRSGAHPGLTGQLQEARWTLRNVEQRFCTIVAVAQAIVDRQKLFFEYGPMAMKPLGLKVIADAVGVHGSTVSRVTNNKYMAMPVGVFELKHFFSRAVVMPSGNACSSTAIRSLVREMIEAETPDKPLRDADLAERLRMQGFPLARRTITKYRLAMNIDIATRRRPTSGQQALQASAGAD